jgi:hypothetical protein
MLRTILLTLLMLAVAIGGGAVSVWLALDARSGIGAVSLGGWTAAPDIDAADADPYSRARASRDGRLPLGRAEGLALIATRDSAGDPLLRQCAYMVEGSIPSARLWTLHAADPTSAAVPSGTRHANFLTSWGVIYLADGSLAIAIGRPAAPGNWLATSGSGPMSLVLTLYDTPLSGEAGLADIVMPQVLRTGCDG